MNILKSFFPICFLIFVTPCSSSWVFPGQKNTPKADSILGRSFEMCYEYSKAFGTIFQVSQKVTGVRPDIQAISRGQKVMMRGKYPHMAALGWRTLDDVVKFKCGGSLISETFVLTAAHCILGRQKPSFVRIGDPNLGSFYTKDYNIQSLIPHEEYNRRTKINDIGVIKLSEKIEFQKSSFLPACLQQNRYFDSSVIATGWGRTSYFGDSSDYLIEANLTLIENDECFAEISDELKIDKIHSGQFCAGDDEGADTCHGDSGSPLQMKVNKVEYFTENEVYIKYNVTTTYKRTSDLFYIVGITSYGGICGSGLPSIYTRVSEYIDWIEAKVWHDRK